MGGTPSRILPALRHVGRALVVALLGGLLAALGASRLAAEPTATSRVAVSDEVGWPFYTTARDRLIETARSPEVLSAVRQAVDVGEEGLELTAASTGGEISVDLTARSTDPGLATEAANRYATEVVDEGAREARAEAADRVRDLNAELLEIDARVADNEAQLLEAGRALDELGDAPAQGPRLVLESQIRRIESVLGEDARRRAQIVQELPGAQDAVDAAVSEFQLVRAAQETSDDLLSDSTTMALLAGLPLFLLGLGASVLWEQTLGIVRRPQDVRWATDAPVFTITYRDDEQIVDATSLQRRMIRQQIPGTAWMLVPVGRNQKATALSTSLAEALRDPLPAPSAAGEAGTERSTVEHPGSAGRSVRAAPGPSPEDESAVSIQDGPMQLLVGARSPELRPSSTVTASRTGQDAAVSGAVLAIVRRGVRLPQLRRAVRDLELEGITVEGIVLFDAAR